MIARAKELNSHDNISYRLDDLESFVLSADDSFDVVHSNLVIQYVVALERMFKEIYKSLKSGGSLLFTVQHPIATASSIDHNFKSDQDGVFWRVSDYHIEGTHRSNYIGAATVDTQHYTMATYINTIIGCGFRLDRIVEWTPTDQEIIEHPDLAVERIRPRFLMIKALKN
eukprot:gene7318-8518_t